VAKKEMDCEPNRRARMSALASRPAVVPLGNISNARISNEEVPAIPGDVGPAGVPGPLGLGLPVFPPEMDPGPSFLNLLKAGGWQASVSGVSACGPRGIPFGLGASGTGGLGAGSVGLPVSTTDVLGSSGQVVSPWASQLRHGTTIVALRFAGGIVMAGDRRATEGHAIAHRTMEKVFAADRYSAVAIAGTAGPAMEMVRLFQVQLEHYEKVEGVALTLEGKANQLGVMVREHFPWAIQGLVVIPLFAGWDTARKTGRIFTYDVTGGHYEEADYQATGSGGRDARTTVKLGFKEGLGEDDAIELAIEALYEAADEDSATGGPDLVRGIFPTVATVTERGFARVEDAEVARRFEALVNRRRQEGREP